LKLVLEISLIFFLTLGVSSIAMLYITGWRFEIGLSQLNAGIFSNFLKNPHLGKINLVELSRRIQEILDNRGGSGFKSPLEPILCLSLPFFVRNKRPLFIPFVWGLTYVFSFLFYKEIHGHYVVFLETAYIMMIAYSSAQFLHEIRSIPLKIYPIRKTLLLIFSFSVLFTISFNFYRLILLHQTLEQWEKGFKEHNLELIQDIQKVVPNEKFILSDTQFLISMADRHVPPWFVDTSFTRIRSGALDCEQLMTCAKDIHTAGLLISPSGRFRSLKCKEESLKEIKRIFPHSKEYRSKALLFWKSYE
jgi:hypothetical protein